MDFDDVAASGLTKKELLGLRREKEKLDKTLGGIRDMGKLPQAVWIVDTKKEHLAVDEARKLKIPVVAILDTNCDPDEVDYPIPGNDDAIRAVALLTRVVADAVADGLIRRSAGTPTEGAPEAEPMPEWEREMLGADAPEAGEAAAAAGEPVAVVQEEPVAESVDVVDVEPMSGAAAVEAVDAEGVELAEAAGLPPATAEVSDNN